MSAPSCSEHPGSHVRRNGYYGRDQQYVKWQCLPADGSKPHMVKVATPLRMDGGLSGCCTECQRKWNPGDGIPTGPNDRFTLKEKATALVALAEGASYRDAARRARRLASRRKTPSPDGKIAAKWLEAYAPVIIDYYRTASPDNCPLVLDKLPIHTRDFSTQKRKKSGRLKFHIFGALIYEQRTPRLYDVRVSNRGSADNWESFLRSLNLAPSYVVCDRDQAMMLAVRRVWPDIEIYACIDHMRQNALAILTAGGLYDTTDPLVQMLERYNHGLHPFSNREGYERFRDALPEFAARHGMDPRARAQRALKHLTDWHRGVDSIVEHSLNTEHHPKSTGALEHELRRIKRNLQDHKTNIRSTKRLELLLELQVLHRTHKATPADWAHVLGERHRGVHSTP